MDATIYWNNQQSFINKKNIHSTDIQSTKYSWGLVGGRRERMTIVFFDKHFMIKKKY